MQRAARTAALAGLADVKQDPGLREWDYGGYEGLTTPQSGSSGPDGTLWRDGVIPGGPGYPGETAEQVGARADAVLSGSPRCWPTATWSWSRTGTFCAC